MTISNQPRLFAIGDLHLPGGSNKPMDVFGSHWEGHFHKIAEDWRHRVTEEDIVLIPGDISWAMQLEEALEDLRAIGNLPGYKVLLRGNHDYWWGSISKLRAALPEKMFAIQNDALLLQGYLLCGSRGWVLPAPEGTPEDLKIFERELQRLELSLRAGQRLAPNKQPVVMTHYPPTDEQGTSTPVTDLLSQYQASHVVYGHLHGPAADRAFRGQIGDTLYHAVSCDGIGFSLFQVPMHA